MLVGTLQLVRVVPQLIGASPKRTGNSHRVVQKEARGFVGGARTYTEPDGQQAVDDDRGALHLGGEVVGEVVVRICKTASRGRVAVWLAYDVALRRSQVGHAWQVWGPSAMS